MATASLITGSGTKNNTVQGSYHRHRSRRLQCPAERCRHRDSRRRQQQHDRRNDGGHPRRHLGKPHGRSQLVGCRHRRATWSRATSSAPTSPARPALFNGNAGVLIDRRAPRTTRSAGPSPGPATSSPATSANGVRRSPARAPRATWSRATSSAPTPPAPAPECNPNSGDGVLIESGASGNTIGGTTAGARNVISGNGYYGVDIDARVPRQHGRGRLHRHRLRRHASAAQCVRRWRIYLGPRATRSAARPPAPATSSRATSATASTIAGWHDRQRGRGRLHRHRRHRQLRAGQRRRRVDSVRRRRQHDRRDGRRGRRRHLRQLQQRRGDLPARARRATWSRATTSAPTVAPASTSRRAPTRSIGVIIENGAPATRSAGRPPRHATSSPATQAAARTPTACTSTARAPRATWSRATSSAPTSPAAPPWATRATAS